MTEVSQAQGQLWGGDDDPGQPDRSGRAPSCTRARCTGWSTPTRSTRPGSSRITNQGYVSAAHEDLEFPTMAGEGTGGNGGAIMAFTLNGNGGPSAADRGGFYPSTAYGRLTVQLARPHRLDDQHRGCLGQSPQDGFSEYQGYPGITAAPLGRLRLGDLSARRQRPAVLLQRVHPVPELQRQDVHADDRNLRRDPGRLRQLGNLGQLRRAVASRPPGSALDQHAAGRGPYYGPRPVSRSCGRSLGGG